MLKRGIESENERKASWHVACIIGGRKLIKQDYINGVNRHAKKNSFS